MARRKSQQVEQDVAVLTVEPPHPFGQLLQKERSVPEVSPVPAGYTELPAGTVRRIRINPDWLKHGNGEPVLVVDDDRTEQYAEVIVDGQSQLQTQVDVACCTYVRSAWLEPSARLFVKQ